jgi:hypothetical protein
MFVKIHKAVKTPAANNKGSCLTLADYLEKENAGKAPGDKMPFFNHKFDTVAKGTAVEQIDRNHKGLSRSDNKFFMVSINPSHHELQHIIKQTTGREGITDFTQLNRGEQDGVFTALRNYTRNVMDIYAQNFDRPNVRNGGDLVYFAKIETMRRWHSWDRDVKEGKARAGSQKEGLNVHVHIVVSRNDATQTTKLSPESRSRGGKQQFNGRPTQQGFNHEVFKIKAGEAFQSMFNYTAHRKERYAANSRYGGAAAPGPGKAALQAAQGKTKNAARTIVNKALSGQFATEKQVANNVITVATIIANPASALNIAKQKIIALFKGIASGNEL